MFKKILVPFDGSKGGEKALMHAVELAKICEAHLSVLTVYRHHSMLEASLSMVRPNEPENMDDLMRTHAKEVAEYAKDKVEENGLAEARAFVKAGYASRTIASFAKDHDYQLIVMGRRGLGSVEGYLMGSVAHKVTSIAPCPVLLV